MHPISRLLLATAFVLPLSQIAPSALRAETAHISVTGEGSLFAPPDFATVSLGVTNTEATAAEAMAANARAMEKVLERLRAVGVAESDLQTAQLQLNPNWKSSSLSSSGEVDGFTASNQLSIRLRDLSRMGEVLDAAVSDGANTLNGVSFDLSTPRPLQDQARRAAVADAIARATLLADAAQVKLGAITSITEGGGDVGGQPMMRASMEKTPIAIGEVEVSQSVTVVFAIAE
jgi:uncharacterized protein